MTDQVDIESQSEAQETPGPLLRDAREQMGLSTQQVAQRLNLRHSVVLGIEQDNYETGTSVTYVRGYIRNYARLVGLNEQRLNSALDSVYKPPVDPAMQSFSERTKRERHDGRWQALTWLIIAALAVALGWWVFTTQFTGEQQARELPQATSLKPAASTAPVPSASSESAAVVAESPQQTGISESVTRNVVEHEQPTSNGGSQAQLSDNTPAAELVNADDTAVAATASETIAEPTLESAAELPVAAADGLTISLSGDCWMLVQDADGNTLIEGLKSAGFTTTVTGATPYRLRLGAPETVSISFNGDDVDLSNFRAGKVARLTVPQ